MCRRTWFGALAGAFLGLFGLPKEAAGAVYNRTHQCPKCGRTVLEVYAPRRAGGHYHLCGSFRSGTWWYH
jgi:hypothetical protein